MQEALLVFDVSQVPEFHRVVDGSGRQQPIAAGVELGVGHFGFVQLVAENLYHLTKKKYTKFRNSENIASHKVLCCMRG